MALLNVTVYVMFSYSLIVTASSVTISLEHWDINVGWVSEILSKWFEGGPSYGNYQHAV